MVQHVFVQLVTRAETTLAPIALERSLHLVSFHVREEFIPTEVAFSAYFADALAFLVLLEMRVQSFFSLELLGTQMTGVRQLRGVFMKHV